MSLQGILQVCSPVLSPGMSANASCSDTCSIKKLNNASVNPSDGLRLSAWEEELQDDVDHEFILNGIKHGFDINDKHVSPVPVECSNHKSAQPGSLSMTKQLHMFSKKSSW